MQGDSRLESQTSKYVTDSLVCQESKVNINVANIIVTRDSKHCGSHYVRAI